MESEIELPRSERAAVDYFHQPDGDCIVKVSYKEHEITSGKQPSLELALAKAAILAMEMWVDG